MADAGSEHLRKASATPPATSCRKRRSALCTPDRNMRVEDFAPPLLSDLTARMDEYGARSPVFLNPAKRSKTRQWCNGDVLPGRSFAQTVNVKSSVFMSHDAKVVFPKMGNAV
jgi:hypothetical protein